MGRSDLEGTGIFQSPGSIQRRFCCRHGHLKPRLPDGLLAGHRIAYAGAGQCRGRQWASPAPGPRGVILQGQSPGRAEFERFQVDISSDCLSTSLLDFLVSGSR